MAVLFVDIRDFTTFANAGDPAEVIGTLRDFMGQIVDAVFRQAGTLDKFLGDGLTATFGTPSPNEDDVTRAWNCSMKIAAWRAWSRWRPIFLACITGRWFWAIWGATGWSLPSSATP
ncbi:MAG: adenylate/guanylate cyclase domain-containing protein [Rhodobacteraceae bacterium]|nr:adenylate/guanylate cyclase domain-containing protein [Paracoccaceae bacterium]